MYLVRLSLIYYTSIYIYNYFFNFEKWLSQNLDFMAYYVKLIEHNILTLFVLSKDKIEKKTYNIEVYSL